MAKVKLAKNQAIYADGVALLGTRDFEIERELDSVDVTPRNASGTAKLTLCETASMKLQVYHIDDVVRLNRKWNKFPPQPVEITIADTAGPQIAFGTFVIESMTIAGPFGGVVSYTVSLSSWPYATSE